MTFIFSIYIDGFYKCECLGLPSQEAEKVAVAAAGLTRTITYKQFIQIIRPSFAKVEDEEDLHAICARSHFIVTTDDHVFWRVASAVKDDVTFCVWPNRRKPDLFNAECKPAFAAYKENKNAFGRVPSELSGGSPLVSCLREKALARRRDRASRHDYGLTLR